MIAAAVVSKSFRMGPPVVPTIVGNAVTNAAPELCRAGFQRSERVPPLHERTRVLGWKALCLTGCRTGDHGGLFQAAVKNCGKKSMR
jgi:hypothetical protein